MLLDDLLVAGRLQIRVSDHLIWYISSRGQLNRSGDGRRRLCATEVEVAGVDLCGQYIVH